MYSVQMRTRIAGAVALVLLTLAGCGKKADPIVGSWKAEPPDLKGVDPKFLQGMDLTMTFNADGSMIQDSKAFGVHSVVKGSYTATKDSVTLTFQSVEAKADDPQKQAQVDQAKQMAQGQLNKPQTTSIAWVSDDKMKLDVGGQGGFTFDRVKS